MLESGTCTGVFMTALSASKINVPTFVEVLRRSNLVDSKRLKHALRSVALTSDQERTPADVAEQLITAGLVTKWQASQLLKAKYRGFFLGKYCIRRPLGRGGMGVVYEAEHSVLNTRVAIKILPKARNDVEKSVSRFLAEARAAAKLNHPNIVRVHDCDVVDDRRFMVMDLVEGTNLGKLVDQHGPLAYAAAIDLIRQSASGLGYAHEQGITHRDVKPHNLLIDREGQLKVADMGLALFEIDSPDRHTLDGNAMLGTVDFVAPEQAWDSRKVDRRADMYSLGCTLYFLLTGKPPFSQGTLAQRLAQHQTAQPTPIPQIRADCPAAVWKLCHRMMAKKPQDRIQRMSEVVSICNQLLPKLSGSGEEIVDLTSNHPSGSDSGISSGSDSWNSGEMLGLQSLHLSMNDSDGGLQTLPDLGTHDPLATTTQPAMSATSPQGTSQAFWLNSPTTNPTGKRQKKASSQIGKQAMLYIGLAVAFCSIVLTAVGVYRQGDSATPYRPDIKQVETADGNSVIIVSDDS